MRKRLIAGMAALTTFAAGAGAIALGGGGSDGPVAPEVNEISIELDASGTGAATVAKARKPRIIYLQGQPQTVNPADPAIGPYVDVALSAKPCSGRARVLDGGVAAVSTDVYQQGSYIEDKNTYHVLIGLDDEAAEAQPPAPYEITTHLICAKGVR